MVWNQQVEWHGHEHTVELTPNVLPCGPCLRTEIPVPRNVGWEDGRREPDISPFVCDGLYLSSLCSLFITLVLSSEPPSDAPGEPAIAFVLADDLSFCFLQVADDRPAQLRVFGSPVLLLP